MSLKSMLKKLKLKNVEIIYLLTDKTAKTGTN